MPSKTVAVITNRITLFTNKPDSRETKENEPTERNLCARNANNNSEEPMTTNKKISINKPRPGSAANECTEVSTPERTKNVPSKLNEKPRIESNIVHVLKLARFSVTARE